MPTTPLGITYPDSTGHTRTWEHWQQLAEDVDGLQTPLSEDPAFAAATGCRLDHYTAARFGYMRTLMIQLTRTGSTLTASSDGNITDETIGVVGNADYRAPTGRHISAMGRCAIAYTDVLMYDTGTTNIGGLNGSGSSIRTDDFLRYSMTWVDL